MKLSRYITTVPNYPKQGSYLLHHNRTQAKIVINEELKSLLDRLKERGDEYQASSDETKYLEALKPSGFVLDSQIDEARQLDHWLNQIRYNATALESLISVTYECNFACPYCIQEGIKGRKLRMDEEMAKKTAVWLLHKAEHLRVEELTPTYYGGEPLMNVAAIETISKMMLNYAEKKGKIYRLRMITNGSLLTEKVLQRLLPLGFEGAKITLDGPKAVHDKKRPFVGGRSSFDVIMDNIENAIDRVGIKINFNFDHDNAKYFPALLDELEERGLKDRILELELSPLVGNYEAKNVTYQVQQGCLSLAQKGMTELMVDLKRQTQERGFKTKPAMGVNICEVMQNEGFVIIDPLGSIYRCPALVGRKEFETGTVDNPEFNALYTKMMTMDMWKDENCYECQFAPMCAGGCRYLTYIRTDNFFKADCEKPFFQKANPEFAKLDYQKAVAVQTVQAPKASKKEPSLASHNNKYW